MKNNKVSTDSYKKERVTKGIWYRIVSVLSAITVFCTTYALILPAITMEDPTLGVKINNKFEFESELLDIDFYVSGRAIFKDKDVDIENPVGDLVDLHVTVLDKDNKAYEDYEAYAIENIGAKDVAQVTALKLKFTYMGHELDMSKCDIKAEINAKEVFFTDIIGSVPDDIYYTSTNHPMATPNDDLLPLAKAVTVAQSTTTELAELPVVYTSDASEVSTLTVDVKGNSMAIASYAMEDYKFKVAYYTTVSELVKLKNNTTAEPSFNYNGGGIEGAHDYIEFSDRRDDKNQYYDYYTLYNPADPYINDNQKGTPLEEGSSELVFIPLVLKSGTAGAHDSTYEFKRQAKYVMLYKTVEYNFSEYYTLMSVNKLANSQNYGNPDIYTNVRRVDTISSGVIEEFSGLPYEFNNIDTVLGYGPVKESGSYNVGLMFSDNEQSTNRLYIEEDSTVLLLYPPVEKELADDVTLIDYDISDGGKDTTQSGKIAMRTDDRGINSFYSKFWNGNHLTNYGKFMFAEGWAWYRDTKSENMKTSLSNTEYYINENVLNFNIDQMYQHENWKTPKAYLYDMVTGVDVSDGDFVPIFDSAISAPNLFSSENDFAPKTMVMNDLVAWYKFDNINNTTWEDSYGGGADNVDLSTALNKEINNENKCLKLASGDYILLPEHFNGNEWSNYGFTLEISFGDVKKGETGTSNYCTILSDSNWNPDEKIGSGSLFNVYLSGANVLGMNSIAGATAGGATFSDNGEDLLSNSTLSITFDPDDSDTLRVYVDGVEIYNVKNANASMAGMGKLRVGNNFNNRKISLEIKEIRMYEEDLRETGVVQNAKYDGHYAPTISSGLVAEYDADIAYNNEDGENQKPKSWATTKVVDATSITFGEDVNYYFNGKGCVITGTGTESGRVTIPSDVISKITGDFTLEIEFGNVKNIPQRTNFVGTGAFLGDAVEDISKREFNIFNDNSVNENYRLNVCIDRAYKSFGLNKGDRNKLGYDVSADTVSYSTLSFVYSETNEMIYVYLNGTQASYNSSMFNHTYEGYNHQIELDGLCFGPDRDGAVIEYRTIRLYNRALSQYEVVQNSKHDGTYNAGKTTYSGAALTTNSFGSMGKTVIGGREIEFDCIGETYVLSSINVNSYDRTKMSDYANFKYKDSGDLDITTYYGNQNLQGFSNFNWPLDQTKTFDSSVDLPYHDFRFGDTDTAPDKNNTNGPGKYAYTGFGERTFSNTLGDTSEAYRLLKTRDSVNHNAYFGMKYKVDFTLSKDYVGPLEYIFQGDDDLWVFLKKTDEPSDKGKLAVDLGGIHAAMGQVVDLWNYIGDGDSRYARDKDQDYTLYVFLLERGAVASTCYMEFTLPSISSLTEGTPTGSLQFAKQVENIETDDEFEFRLDLEYPIGITESAAKYTVFKEDGTADSNQIDVPFDSYPIVSLKSGQMVRFDMIPIGTKYTLTETPNIYYHTSVRKNTGGVDEGNVVEGEITENTDIIIFYNSAGVELPSTGESGVVAYFIPFIVATAWMFTMPYMDKTNKWRAKGRKREE